MNRRTLCISASLIVSLCCGYLFAQQNQSAPQQKISKEDRERARAMLGTIADDVRKHYYDPKFHGLDWSATVQATQQAIDNATSLNRALSEIAAALDKLNDSHVFFVPPPRPFTHEFGWRLEMIGDHCFVTQVRPQSDVEAKGIKRGDEVLALNGFQPARDSLPKMMYVFNLLRPQTALHVALRSPDGQTREIDVAAAMRQRKKVVDLTGGTGGNDLWDLVRQGENIAHQGRARWLEPSGDLMVLKFPGFDFTDTQINDMMNKARKRKALIIDLRGNGGGSEDTLKALIGEVLDHEVKLGDRITRDGKKSLDAKSRGHNAFSGKLVVLVDNESASAAELFAHLMQIEKRATVLGDQSAGKVMRAKEYSYKYGMDTIIFYGASITESDIIMTDGKSLEKNGVIPDELILPTAADLAAGRDPVMVRAAEICGVKMNPEAAGALFPYDWPSL